MRAPRLQASLVCFKLLRSATSASPSFAVDDSREPRRVVVVCSSTCAGSGSVGASQTSNCDIQRSVRLDHARAEGAVRSVHRLQCHHAASSAVPSAGRRNMHGNGEAARKFRLSRMPNHCQGAPWRGTWFCECSVHDMRANGVEWRCTQFAAQQSRMTVLGRRITSKLSAGQWCMSRLGACP